MSHHTVFEGLFSDRAEDRQLFFADGEHGFIHAPGKCRDMPGLCRAKVAAKMICCGRTGSPRTCDDQAGARWSSFWAAPLGPRVKCRAIFGSSASTRKCFTGPKNWLVSSGRQVGKKSRRTRGS